ncbi:MAG: hypothetical protein ACAI44_37420 [Candidatus Sericytochromatia bacterium]
MVDELMPESRGVAAGGKGWLLDAGMGVGAALLLLVILFFAGGGSNFIYIDF